LGGDRDSGRKTEARAERGILDERRKQGRREGSWTKDGRKGGERDPGRKDW